MVYWDYNETVLETKSEDKMEKQINEKIIEIVHQVNDKIGRAHV